MFNGGKGVGSQAGRVLKGVEFLVYAVRRDLALRLQGDVWLHVKLQLHKKTNIRMEY